MVCFGLQRYGFYLKRKRKTIIFYGTDDLTFPHYKKGVQKSNGQREDL